MWSIGVINVLNYFQNKIHEIFMLFFYYKWLDKVNRKNKNSGFYILFLIKLPLVT